MTSPEREATKAVIVVILGCALVLTVCAVIDACSGSQAKEQAQYAAIVAGCKAGLDISRNAGEAGQTGEIEKGCAAELRSWEHQK